MRHLDLFSGIGGFSLAADWIWPDVEHIFCEIDPFCQKVLNKHWPQSKIYGDIRELRGGGFGTVDLVTGGFPCQPFSTAGKRKGKEDDRDLWPHMFRIITEAKPYWVIGENVAGFIKMELDRSISDLESAGYEVRSFVIPACAVGAPHRRDRVWIVANTRGAESHGVSSIKREKISSARNSTSSNTKSGKNRRGEQRQFQRYTTAKDGEGNEDATNAAGNHEQGIEQEQKLSLQPLRADPFLGAWEARKSLLPSAVLCRTDDGIPNRVDRTRALGNAIVPQVAAEIMRAIKAVDV